MRLSQGAQQARNNTPRRDTIMRKHPTVAPSVVGLRLQTARILAGLSTDEAAKRLGIKSPSRLTRAEHPSC